MIGWAPPTHNRGVPRSDTDGCVSIAYVHHAVQLVVTVNVVILQVHKETSGDESMCARVVAGSRKRPELTPGYPLHVIVMACSHTISSFSAPAAWSDAAAGLLPCTKRRPLQGPSFTIHRTIFIVHRKSCAGTLPLTLTRILPLKYSGEGRWSIVSSGGVVYSASPRMACGSRRGGKDCPTKLWLSQLRHLSMIVVSAPYILIWLSRSQPLCK
jgi:hypothetical protein